MQKVPTAFSRDISSRFIPKIYIKSIIDCRCFAYFDTKVHYTARIGLFLTFKLFAFLVQTLQCAETVILDLFCP